MRLKFASQVEEETGGFEVELTSIGREQAKFKGFLIQARDSRGNPIGEFEPTDRSRAKYLECSSEYPKAVITHKDNGQKSFIKAEWKAPKGFNGVVTFVATAVEKKTTFWKDIKAEKQFTSTSAAGRPNINGGQGSVASMIGVAALAFFVSYYARLF